MMVTGEAAEEKALPVRLAMDGSFVDISTDRQMSGEEIRARERGHYVNPVSETTANLWLKEKLEPGEVIEVPGARRETRYYQVVAEPAANVKASIKAGTLGEAVFVKPMTKAEGEMATAMGAKKVPFESLDLASRTEKALGRTD